MKVLLLRTDDKIGDTVVETCFYRELKKFFPDAHLTVMACGCRPILRTVPYIDEFIWLRPGGLGRFIDAFLALPYVWKQNYEVLVSLTPTTKMKFFNYFVRAKQKIPFEYLHGFTAASAYERVLKQLGVAGPIDTSYELCVPQEAQQAVQSFLEKNNLTARPFLFFNPSGGDPNRTLTPARVNELATALSSSFSVVVCNYRNAYDACKTQAILFDCEDILQTAALLEQATYVLTVDTGIAHIATIFDKPMTVLFSLKNYTNEPTKDLTFLTTWTPRGSSVKSLWAEQSVNDIPTEQIVTSVSEGWSRVSKQP